MATNFLTPNMNLLVPVVGAELSPTWAQDLNVSLGTIDGHNHASGSGVQINPNGLNINAALTFHGNQAINLGFIGISAQASGIPTPINDSVYVSGVDLYYQDGNGNAIQLTKSGGPNAGTGNISGLPSTPTGGAGLAWLNSSSTFQFTQDSGGAGPAIDGGAYVLRYGGSYPSPSGNYIVFAAPSSLSGGYQLTLPAAVPASSGSFLTEDTSGVLSYTNVDGSTVTLGGGLISVGTITSANIASGTITGTQIHSNVNLPGESAKVGSLNIVVSNTNTTNGLAIVRGGITSGGSPSIGEGFSSSLSGTTINVTFTSPFGDVPAVTANAIVAEGASVDIQTLSSTGFSAIVYAGNSPTNQAITFIAIGQRD